MNQNIEMWGEFQRIWASIGKQLFLFFYPPGYTPTIREIQLLQNIIAALVRNCSKLKKLAEQRSNLSGIEPHQSSQKKPLVCHVYIQTVSKSIAFSLISESILAQNGLSSLDRVSNPLGLPSEDPLASLNMREVVLLKTDQELHW